MTKEDIIERAKRISLSSNPKDYIEFVGELARLDLPSPQPKDNIEEFDDYNIALNG